MGNRIDNMDQKTKDLLVHLMCLMNEVDTLKGKVEAAATGHIRTAISVLQERIKEIKQQLLES